jgi:hypothetical protein
MPSNWVAKGISAGPMKLRRRTSSGSMPSSSATWSTTRSIMNEASGRPAPR